MQSVCTVSHLIRANDLGTRLPYIELPKSLVRIKQKNCSEQDKSIATGPFYVRTKFERI